MASSKSIMAFLGLKFKNFDFKKFRADLYEVSVISLRKI